MSKYTHKRNAKKPNKVSKNFIKIGTKPDDLTHQEYYYFCLVNSYSEQGKYFFRKYTDLAKLTTDSPRAIKGVFKRLKDKEWLKSHKKRGRTRTWSLNDDNKKVFKATYQIEQQFISCYNDWGGFEIGHLSYKILCQLIGNELYKNDYVMTRKKLAEYHNTSFASINRTLRELRESNIIEGEGEQIKLRYRNNYQLKTFVDKHLSESKETKVRSLRERYNQKPNQLRYSQGAL